MGVGAPDREEYGPRSRPLPFERGTDGPRVVLVGVDGTRTSLRAASYAAGLARRQGAALVVVFVHFPTLYTALADGVVAGAVQRTHDDLAADLRAECRREAESLGLPVTFLSRRGDAYAELSAAATRPSPTWSWSAPPSRPGTAWSAPSPPAWSAPAAGRSWWCPDRYVRRPVPGPSAGGPGWRPSATGKSGRPLSPRSIKMTG